MGTGDLLQRVDVCNLTLLWFLGDNVRLIQFFQSIYYYIDICSKFSGSVGHERRVSIFRVSTGTLSEQNSLRIN